jgi:hypothetical protein
LLGFAIPKRCNLPGYVVLCAVLVLDARSSVAETHELKGSSGRAGEPIPTDLLDVDHKALVSQADLIYETPVERPVEGQPIGNGRMGTLVWTSAGAVHFQINRNDVFAVNRNHAGAQFGPTDYCGGCASVVLDVGGQPLAAGEAFRQRLSLYDAEALVAGAAVELRCFVSSQTDVLVLEIDDQRLEPQPIRLTVSMWRAPEVVHGNHAARYRFSESNDSVTIVQTFDEKDHHCASAVAVRVADEETGRPGRQPGTDRKGWSASYRSVANGKARQENRLSGACNVQIERTGERSRSLVAPARRGKRIIFIASSASLGGEGGLGRTGLQARSQRKTDGPGDPSYQAVSLLKAVERRSYDHLFESIRGGGASSGHGPLCV